MSTRILAGTNIVSKRTLDFFLLKETITQIEDLKINLLQSKGNLAKGFTQPERDYIEAEWRRMEEKAKLTKSPCFDGDLGTLWEASFNNNEMGYRPTKFSTYVASTPTTHSVDYDEARQNIIEGLSEEHKHLMRVSSLHAFVITSDGYIPFQVRSDDVRLASQRIDGPAGGFFPYSLDQKPNFDVSSIIKKMVYRELLGNDPNPEETFQENFRIVGVSGGYMALDYRSGMLAVLIRTGLKLSDIKEKANPNFVSSIYEVRLDELEDFVYAYCTKPLEGESYGTPIGDCLGSTISSLPFILSYKRCMDTIHKINKELKNQQSELALEREIQIADVKDGEITLSPF